MTLTPEQEHVERVRELARHLATDRPTVRLGAAPLSVRERYAEPLDALLSEITELRARVEAINAHVPTHGLWRCDCCDGLYAGANCSSYPRCPNASATGAGPEEIAAAWGRVRELVEAARAVVRLGGGSYWRLTRALAPFDEEGT